MIKITKFKNRYLILIITTIFLVMGFLVSSCSQEKKTIHIGYNAWIGNGPLIIANENRFFEKAGVNVKIHYFTSLHDEMLAFSEGKIDIMFSTTNEVLLLADKGEKLKIVLIIDYSNGADAIVAKQSIRSVKNLIGKKVGVERGSISHFTLLRALQKADLKSNDVNTINITGEEAIAMFPDSLDAIVTWDPFINKATEKGGHVIFSSREIPGEIIDVISIRQSLLEKYPRDCLKIITAYLKSLDWLNENYENGLDIISKSLHVQPNELKKSLKNIQLTKINENVTAFGNSQKQGQLYFILQKLITFSLGNNLIAHTLKANTLIDQTYIEQYRKPYLKGDML